MNFFKGELKLLGIYLLILFLIIQLSLISGKSTEQQTKIKPQDTLVPIVDATINVQDNVALFIGDSHTANQQNGWQKVLCDKTGMICNNASVGGKTTYWMLEMGVYKLNNKIDYCFIYGGANDMYSSHIRPEDALKNIQGIARMCNKLGIKCYVLTGFDPRRCTRTQNPNYVPRYEKLQQLILTEYLEGATPIDVRVVDRKDCWDNLCHMSPAGHKKIAEKIIKDLKLKTIK
jgi:lysophospholipase L1-like esterase